MPQVKYIAKGVKTDSIRGVGLRWEPEQVRNVTAEVAERLLVHTDTWATVESVRATDEPILVSNETIPPAEEPIGLSKDEKLSEEPLPVVDFHAMDKATLIKFAETNYNEHFDKRQSEDTLRHKVIALVARNEFEKESEAK